MSSPDGSVEGSSGIVPRLSGEVGGERELGEEAEVEVAERACRGPLLRPKMPK